MPDSTVKLYWKSVEERESAGDGSEPSRRDFLRAAGFSLAAAASACTPAPVERAIPLLVQPEEMTPGRVVHYASTCGGCAAGCGLLVRSRDGRPIKLEGNPNHPMSRGGLCAVGQASVLPLYDSLRLSQPTSRGRPASWADVDREIRLQLETIRNRGGAVRFLSGTITSPTLQRQIAEFLGRFTDARHVVYDALSASAILDAHALAYGARTLPRLRFERAEVVVGIDADFLGSWISPVEFTNGYREGRVPASAPPRLSRHFQVESVLSLTGSRADERVVLAPAEILPFVSHLAARLARRGALDGVRPVGNLREATSAVVDRLVETLWATRGRSLVACGSQDVSVQAQCILVNQLLGNYGSTIDLERPSFQRSGNDRDAAALQDEIRSGGVAALFVGGVNPVYDLPGGEAFAAALEKVPLSVSFSERDDETASLATFVCPDRHFLETWADAEPVAGVVSVTQPVIRPLGDTRPIVESLATWTNTPIGAREILRRSWERHVYPRRRSEMTFDQFWEAAVHDGYVEVNTAATAPRTFSMPPPPIAPAGSAAGDGLSLVLYAKTALLDGRHAHNAWLQELPDPVSKVAWDNYACLSPATAARFQLETGDIVGITAEDGNRSSVDLPVLVQPGQHDGVVAIALGYGRRGTDRFARVGPQWFEAKPGVGDNGLVGVNAAPLLDRVAGVVRYAGRRVLVAKSGRHRDLAATQSHDSIMVPARLAPAGAERRPTVEETTLDAYAEDPTAGAHHHEAPGQDLWPQDHTYGGHRWGMAIDLNACTGCSACVISCQAENNIPVVGRDEVLRHREMHWIRIDRYYAGSDASPDVLHQPMLCQHCENAPCEVVCPVLATVHSSEGLNQQIYNRCVGTRYCANNCPYKVRRFNWFDYPHEDRLQNLVLNPDVTVRSRGVMEKCSFCIQRIQDAKLEAKRRGESLQDGEVQTACQQSCPARAIVFGDLNNPSSEVARLTKGPRSFRVLEELNVRPSVSYLRMVRNRAKSAETEHG